MMMIMMTMTMMMKMMMMMMMMMLMMMMMMMIYLIIYKNAGIYLTSFLDEDIFAEWQIPFDSRMKMNQLFAFVWILEFHWLIRHAII